MSRRVRPLPILTKTEHAQGLVVETFIKPNRDGVSSFLLSWTDERDQPRTQAFRAVETEEIERRLARNPTSHIETIIDGAVK